jgi:hypothetical protein
MVVVVILPFAQFLVEQMDVVADAVVVQELVELLVVDAMRPLHLAIETRGARANVDVPNIEALEVPVELGLELGAVIGLHDMHAKRQPADDLVDDSSSPLRLRPNSLKRRAECVTLDLRIHKQTNPAIGFSRLVPLRTQRGTVWGTTFRR